MDVIRSLCLLEINSILFHSLFDSITDSTTERISPKIIFPNNNKMGLEKFVTVLTVVLSLTLLTNAEYFNFFRQRNRNRARQNAGQEVPSMPGFPALMGLPVPNGPFYGMPFEVSSTMTGQFPFTVSGACEEGKLYNITKIADFQNYYTELECVHNVGLPPRKVPEGAFYGSPLSFSNSPLFNVLVSSLWKGKMTTQMECNGNQTYIGWNNIAGNPTFPFVASIEPHRLYLAPGEHYDTKNALVFDHTQNMNQVCPDYGANLQKNFDSAVVRKRNIDGMFPMNQVVDVLKFVGKQEDGASIYLGKLFMRDFYRDDLQAATVGYVAFVNYDETAHPIVLPGFALPPTLTRFKYMHPGSIDLFLRAMPLDNLLTNPVRTAGKFVRGVLKTGRQAARSFGERTFGFGNFMANQRRFRDAFNAGRNIRPN